MKSHGVYHFGWLLAAASVALLWSCNTPVQQTNASLPGTWRQDVTYSAAQAGSNPTNFRFDFQFGSDGSMELTADVYESSQYTLLGGEIGTYTTSSDIINLVETEEYQFDYNTSTGQWVSATGTGSAQYKITGNTMTLTVDYTGDGVYDTSHPIQDVYPGGTGTGPTEDITYTLTKISG